MGGKKEEAGPEGQGESVGGVQCLDRREKEGGQAEVRTLCEGREAESQGKIAGIPRWMPQLLGDVRLMIQGGVGATARTLSPLWATDFPGWKFLGIEPHPVAWRMAEKAWPGTVLPYALHDSLDTVKLYDVDEDSGSLNRPLGVQCRRSWSVGSTTLNDVADYVGDPAGTFLWLDVPDDPLPALRSAERMLPHVVAMTVRVPLAPRYLRQARMDDVEDFLCEAGFCLRRVFGHTPRWALTFWQPRH